MQAPKPVTSPCFTMLAQKEKKHQVRQEVQAKLCLLLDSRYPEDNQVQWYLSTISYSRAQQAGSQVTFPAASMDTVCREGECVKEVQGGGLQLCCRSQADFTAHPYTDHYNASTTICKFQQVITKLQCEDASHHYCNNLVSSSYFPAFIKVNQANDIWEATLYASSGHSIWEIYVVQCTGFAFAKLFPLIP